LTVPRGTNNETAQSVNNTMNYKTDKSAVRFHETQ